MCRRELREHLFLMLFRRDFYETEELKEQMELYLEQLEKPSEKDLVYLEKKFQTVLEYMQELDEKLSFVATGWKLNRMGKVELTILRLAVYEMEYDEDVPVKVAINEAVELAKKYGEDNSAGFVNGVLAKVAKDE
ncbi:MAG: transcription antitermination factor NusB [Acetivibrio ethanolgignens]